MNETSAASPRRSSKYFQIELFFCAQKSVNVVDGYVTHVSMYINKPNIKGRDLEVDGLIRLILSGRTVVL